MKKLQIKVGIDMARTSRLEQLAQNRAFLERVFHLSELYDTRPEHLAGIFAAKEAFFKALGLTPRWLWVEVAKQPSGKPFLRTGVELPLDALSTFDLSITHEGDYAIAIVVMLFETEQVA